MLNDYNYEHQLRNLIWENHRKAMRNLRIAIASLTLAGGILITALLRGWL